MGWKPNDLLEKCGCCELAPNMARICPKSLRLKLHLTVSLKASGQILRSSYKFKRPQSESNRLDLGHGFSAFVHLYPNERRSGEPMDCNSAAAPHLIQIALFQYCYQIFHSLSNVGRIGVHGEHFPGPRRTSPGKGARFVSRMLNCPTGVTRLPFGADSVRVYVLLESTTPEGWLARVNHRPSRKCFRLG